jgi:hypothetical protein
MINAKLQSIIDTKSAIGNAIVNKGGTITSETPFFNYAAQIDGISTGGGAYSTYVVEDIYGAKYTAFNGYDKLRNPNPTDIWFNQWLLNNSASGDIVITNTIMSSFTYNGTNSTTNISQLPNVSLVNFAYPGGALTIHINDNFLYIGGSNATVNPVRKVKIYDALPEYPEISAQFPIIVNSPNFGGVIWSITSNNNFVYVGGRGPSVGPGYISKYHDSNLVFVANTASYGGDVINVAVNNGFVYAGGNTTQTVRKYHESNLAYVGQTANYGGQIKAIVINNGFLYVGGHGEATNGKIQKFYESNLARENNSVVYSSGYIESLAINNGYVYAGGFGPSFAATNLSKYHDGNLAFVANSVSYDGAIRTIKLYDNFIYFSGGQGGATNTVFKNYESNLAFVGNSATKTTQTDKMEIYNGVIIATNGSTLFRCATQNVVSDNSIAYTIKKIKE